MSFWQILAWPFGKILYFCYLLVRNYGWALFLFTAIIRLIMFPSSYNQQISTEKMNRLNPKLEAIKKKYANNQDKLNEATMELYNQENVNPMGSCLPTIITFVLLFAIIEVVYAPLSYIGNVDSDSLDAAEEMVIDVYNVSSVIDEHETTVSELLAENTNLYDVLLEYKAEEDSDLADYSDERLEELAAYFEEYNDAYDNDGEMIGLDEYFLDSNLVSSRLVASGSSRSQLLVISVSRVYPDLFTDDVVDLCADFDYTFLGIDLGDYPSWTSVLVLIPIMSLALQLLLTFISQYFTKKKGGATTSGSMKIMLYAMPLLSFWIAFSFPAGIGIYWIFSSLLSLVQTVFLNLYLTPARVDKIIAKDNEKAKKKRKKKSIYQQALEAQQAELQGKQRKSYDDDEDEDDDATEEVKLSRAQKKEAERATLNEARRRYAEKYGDSLDVDAPEMEDSKTRNK
ncbi:MAG: YidC/Oxa1 family membrane protein insertase [Oscillospiraceae bacterium]|nr:YidC/Oxa1 family membrane protein insertase [Ruminococcus sp.]MCD8346087.1 YidC/Oxa1 family membrane protein insertase [Oscillospiraceae bacterium]